MDTNLSSYRASALIVAIGQYDDSSHDELIKILSATQKLADVLVEGGYQHAFPELLQGGEKEKISPIIQKWLQDASEKDTLLLYWAGHGKSDIDGHYLITRNSPGKNLDAENAFLTAVLGKMLVNSSAEKILVILDTCFSGAGAIDIAGTISKVLAASLPIRGTKRRFAIFASAHPLKKVQEAEFCEALTALLAKGDTKRRWTNNDEFIHTDDLAEALQENLDESIGYNPEGSGQRFVPNPRYRGALPAEDVETRQRRLTLAEAEEHFLPASRGIDIGSSGWYFTGRERLFIELVDWLKDTERGMVVVTGPAGSGKSAVMGRLAILSDPDYRKIAESEQARSGVPIKTLPPKGIINVAVHAKGKTLADCIGSIAAGLDIPLSARDRTDPSVLLEAIRGLNKRITIIVDALDEAKPGHHFTIGGRLLGPMARIPQVRVLVGTRRSPDGVTIPESESWHARLRGLFGEDARIFDLEDEPDTKQDIAEYVRTRLMDSRHRNDPVEVNRISKAVAGQSAGIFLYARVVARTLEEAESLAGKLPEDAQDAFVADLTRRFGNREEMVDEMLCALAWGEGKGLSRRVWAPVANALSRTGAHYTDGDVTWMLENAGWHIIEAGEEGQAAYRLPHQVLADYYRKRFEEQDANSRITHALSEGIAGEGWLNADPYLWRHLASHAATADLLDSLLTDPGYLAVADPTKLVPVLSKVTKKNVQDIANIYRRVAYQLYSTDHIDRMAIIHSTAKQEKPDIADTIEPPVATAWKCRWASWQPSVPHLAIIGHGGYLTSVALGEVDRSPVVVSGSRDCSLRLWDARSGRALGEPLIGHEGWVTSVALGEVDGLPVVVSASGDQMVRLWDARTGRALGEPFIGHEDWVTSVALGVVDRSPVVASGSRDQTIRLWDARTGRALGEPLIGHESDVHSVALGVVDRSPVVVSGSEDQTVRLWDVRTGRALGEPLIGHEDWVTSVALGVVNGSSVVVSGSRDQTVRLWDARTGRALGEPLTGHNSMVTSVALGVVDGLPMVVSGSLDQTVRLWDARTGCALAEPLTGHNSMVTSVAVGEVDGSPVVASGSEDQTVRLWDARGVRPLGDSFTGHEGAVTSVAVGEVDGSPVVVSGSNDKTVRLWDAYSGCPLGDSFTGHEGAVTSVAVGKVDGSPVVVSGSGDQTVRLWDARSGLQLGDPLIGHEHWVTSVAVGEVDGSPVVASGSYDQTMRLWDARTGRALGEPLIGHEGDVYSVALGVVDRSPVVVSGSGDQTVRLWDARTGRALGEPLIGHESWVTSVTLGVVDGLPVVVSGSVDRTVRLWDARTGRPLLEPFIGHEDSVTSVALGVVDGSPLVASGSYDQTVRLWVARTGSKSKILLPLRSRVKGLAFAGQSTIVVATAKGLLTFDLARISYQ